MVEGAFRVLLPGDRLRMIRRFSAFAIIVPGSFYQFTTFRRRGLADQPSDIRERIPTCPIESNRVTSKVWYKRHDGADRRQAQNKEGLAAWHAATTARPSPVGRLGLEPRTIRLKAECSTN